MVGGPFQHQNHISINDKPGKNLIWTKDSQDCDIKIFFDEAIIYNIGREKKGNYAWIFESRSIFNRKNIYDNIEKISNSYELVFTHDQELLEMKKNFIFVPANSFWIKKAEIKKKNKLVSFIVSNKNYTIGQKKRHDLLKIIPDYVDVFGFGIKPISEKEEGLSEYMFSICIENDKYDSYFTEKILDCFASGTIPIYWGTNKISDFFERDGILDLIDNFDFSLLTEDLYNSKREFIINNLEKVKGLENLEDLVFEYIKNR